MDTYEKKYKETLERAKLSRLQLLDIGEEATEIEYIFPELKESEDEQIRKELTKHLKEGVEGYMPAGDSSDYRRWLDWLEKQDKSSDQIHYWTEEEIEPIISDYLRGAEHYGGMIARLRCLKPKSLEKQGEQKPTQEIEPFEAEHGKYYYCIKDYFCGGRKQASKGDVVQALRGLPIMGLKDAGEYFLPVNSIKCNSAWSEEDEKIRDEICIYIGAKEDISLDVHNRWLSWLEKQGEVESDNDDIEVEEKGIREAFNKIEDEKQCKQKPQRMISAEAKEAMYNKPANTVEPKCEESKTKIFDAPTPFEDKLYVFVAACEFLAIPSKIEFILEHSQEILDAAREQIGKEQSSTWSKEDEERFQSCIKILQTSDGYDTINTKWFKSLKDRVQPQATWKPSNEQMATLYKYAEQNNYDGSILTSLYNDLKKLREE